MGLSNTEGLEIAKVSVSLPADLKTEVAHSVRDGHLREAGMTTFSAAVERGLRLVLREAKRGPAS